MCRELFVCFAHKLLCDQVGQVLQGINALFFIHVDRNFLGTVYMNKALAVDETASSLREQIRACSQPSRQLWLRSENQQHHGTDLPFADSLRVCAKGGSAACI